MRRCQRRICRHIVTLFANSRLFRTNKQRQAPILTTALEAAAIFAVEEVLHLLEFKLTAGSDRHERRQPRHSKSTDNFKVFRMRL